MFRPKGRKERAYGEESLMELLAGSQKYVFSVKVFKEEE
jgi:hypothetical protein